MRLADYDYHLPKNLIAQEPATTRDSSRLLVLDRNDGSIRHMLFSDIVSLLCINDVMMLNQTRVFPARIFGSRSDTGGRVELLLIRRQPDGKWLAMGKPASALQPGRKLTLSSKKISATVKKRTMQGRVLIEFDCEDVMPVLENEGVLPLPPYINREATKNDSLRYQTVFSKTMGAIAAPTAGLHFTGELLEKISEIGTFIAPLLLHVGPGTFEPVRCIDPKDHKIEEEYYEIGRDSAEIINRSRASGGRAIAVGTTVVRAVETSISKDGVLESSKGFTDSFIFPPYNFKCVDVLVTNFHLPKSTLLMLVAAFAGYEYLMKAYREAVDHEYRFYSYGDAMVIL
tara:strand:+ start:8991 stop:10019 length:1029 start_codon:yes stop_codon:yes gene_type:complete